MEHLNKYVFFLGGQDLEMQEIRKLLEDKGLIESAHFFDEKLSWGASLADYAGVYATDRINVCIELSEKEEGEDLVEKFFPDKALYKRIDHHNELSDRPSALEQVAELLNIDLKEQENWDRLKLVVANDVGYIPAMKEQGATLEEIESIRKEDRMAQGATEEDEKKAEKELEDPQSFEKVDDIALFKTSLKRFSPIVDRLRQRGENRILIYNEEELTYFGWEWDKKHLIDHYKKDIHAGRMYHGGQKGGYFGVDKNSFQKNRTKFTGYPKDLKHLASQIIQQLSHIKPSSSHIFLFPFQWEGNTPHQEEEVSLDAIITALKDKKWESDYFTPDEEEKYNEFNYFYEFVRDILYEKNDPSEGSQDHFFYHLEYKDITDRHLCIQLNRPQSDQYDEYYRLKVESILLNFYKTGVGILSLHLENDTYSAPQSILEINQFGRRIFAPFRMNGASNELAKAIWWDNCADTSDYYLLTDSTPLSGHPFIMPKFLKDLFDGVLVDPNEGAQENSYPITPILDDRMFVISWYESALMAKRLTQQVKESKEENLSLPPYLNDSFWYQYVFVDGNGPSCEDPEMFTHLLKEHTYSRWLGYKTLYGISRYSFVGLGDGGASFLKKHMKTLYYKMVELVLVQRATVLRYSHAVTEVSRFTTHTLEEPNKATRRAVSLAKIRQLNLNYLEFVNKIYFREITAQEQGIELYDMLQELMRIEDQVKDLEGEINDLHRYASVLEEEIRSEEAKKMTHRVNLITLFGALFLIPSFLLSFYGIKVFEPLWEYMGIPGALLVGTFMIIVGGYSLYQVMKNQEEVSLIDNFRWLLSLLFVVFVLPFILIAIFDKKIDWPTPPTPTKTEIQVLPGEPSTSKPEDSSFDQDSFNLSNPQTINPILDSIPQTIP